MAQMRHVDANLMRTPGLQLDCEQAMASIARQDRIIADRVPTASHHGHRCSSRRMSAYWRIDTTNRARHPSHQSPIIPFDAPVL